MALLKVLQDLLLSIYPPAVHEQRKKEVKDKLIERLFAIKEECDRYETVYYPHRVIRK
jgi:hypothetical protein